MPGGIDTATINSGAPTLSAATNVGTVNLSSTATLNAGPALTVSNAFNWTGGSLTGELVTSSGATLTFNNPGNNLNMMGATIVNGGTVLWDAGTLYCNNSTVVTNNGSWQAQGDNAIYNPYGGTVQFYNYGVFTKSPTSQTTFFQGVALNNYGTVNANTGVINLGSGGFLDGPFNAASAGTILLTGGTFTHGPNAAFNGPGVNSMTGGALTLTNIAFTNLALSGGTVTLASTFEGGSITNLTIVGALLSGTNTVTGNLNFSGTLTGALMVGPTAACYITNLALNGLLTIAANATLNLVTTGTKSVYSSTVINNGTVVWNGGTIECNSGTVITNNGTWEAQTDDYLYDPYGGPPASFYNYGTFVKSPTTGTSEFYAVALNNFGALEVQSGTVNLSGGGLFQGTFLVSAGAQLTLSSGGYLDGNFSGATGSQISLSGGTFSYGSQLSFASTGNNALTGGSLTLTNTAISNLFLSGGTVTLGPSFQGGSITNLTLTGANLSGTNILTGNLYWPAGSISGLLTIASSGTLYLNGAQTVNQYAVIVNAGHIVWNGSGNWYFYDQDGSSGFLTNLPSGIVDAECNQVMANPNGQQVGFGNAGLFRKSLSSATTTVNVLFTNTGMVEVTSGAMAFGYGDFAGQFQLANGTSINLNGGGILAGSFSAGLGALVELTGGSFTETEGLLLSGEGTYEMNNNATLTLLNSLIPNLQLDGGTIMTGSNFQGGVITNLSLTNLTLASSNLVTGQLTVIGTINSPLTIASGATLTWSGPVSAPITVESGATLNWLGGGMNAPLYIPTNAILNINAIYGIAQSDLLTNAGTINWQGGNIRICCNNSWYNLGTFNIQCDQTLQNYYNGEALFNSGVIRKLPSLDSQSTGTTYLDSFLYNTGLVDVQDGTLNVANYTTNAVGGVFQCEANAAFTFTGGGVVTGSYLAAAGGAMYFQAGSFTMTPPYFLTGAGTYQVNGGTITLNTNLIPNLQLDGGTIMTGSNFQGGVITNLSLTNLTLASSNLVTGQLTVIGTINSPLTIASGATLTWSGTVNAPITVESGATLNWLGGGMNAPLYIPTNAILNINAIYGTAQSDLLTNAGTINWQGGTIRICCNNSWYNLGTFNIQCDQTLQNYYNGEALFNSGVIRKLPSLDSQSTGTTYLDSFLYNTGLVDVQDGTLNVANYTTNAVGGVFQCEANAAFTFTGGGVLTGSYLAAAGGAIYFQGGSFTMTPPYFLTGGGAYQVNGATITLNTNLIPNLQLDGGTIMTGSNFQGGVITNLSLTNLTLASSNLVTGQLTVIGTINSPLTIASGATLTWSGTVNAPITVESGATLNWLGGGMNAPLYIPTNAVLNINAIYGTAQSDLLTNAGTINWQGGNIRICCNNSWYNLGTFNIQCDQTLQNYYDGEYFNNSGLLYKASTTGGTSLQPFVINSGTIDVESGQIDLNNTFTESGGTWILGLDGPGNNGQINFNGAASLPADFIAHLNNGYVLGLSNSFTLMNYSSFSGTISSTNLPTNGASWSLNVGSTATTLLLTNLDAPRNVTITTPTNNQQFVIPVSIPLTATASDSFATIAMIQFYQGTNLIGQALSSPYTVTWNNVQPGVYTLTAEAIDRAGAMAVSAPVNITVYYNHAQTTNYTWTGAVSQDWFTPSNWVPNNIPGALDNVTLANGGTINLLNNVSINNLNLVNGTLAGASQLTVTNTAFISGGTMSGYLNIPTNGVLAVGNSFNLSGGTLINGGTVLWTNGSMYGNPATVVTNNGLWLAEVPYTMGFGQGAIFANNGTFRLTNTSGTVSLNSLLFVNKGLVDAEAGAINFSDGGALTGTYNSAANAAINFSGGTFTLGALPALTGLGAFEFTGGTLTIANNPAPALQLIAGTVELGPVFQNAGAITNLTLVGSTLSGTYTLDGQMNWSAGSLNGQLTIAPTGVWTLSSGNNKFLNSSTVINNGQVIWTGGYIYGDSATLITNNGPWLVQCDQTMTFGNGSSAFVNNNTFLKTAGTGTTSLNNLLFVNNGMVEASSGAISFGAGGVMAGTYNAAAGASIYFANGTFTLAAEPTFAGGGTFAFTGGQMSVETNLPSALLIDGGNLTLSPSFQSGGKIINLTNDGATLSGNYTVTGAMTWLSGNVNGSLTIATNATLTITASGLSLDSNSSLTNNGTVMWQGGGLNGGSSAYVINNNLWLASANNYEGSGMFFTNYGIFRNTASTTYFYSSLENYGLLDIQGGALSLYGGGTIAGNINVGQFGSLQINQNTYTAPFPLTITGAGSSVLNGGTLNLLSDQIGNLQMNGGTVVLGPAFQNAGAITNLTLSGSALAGSNNVTGTLTWTGGTSLPSGAWLNIAPDGLLNLTTGSTKTMLGVLVNNGTVSWTGGAIQGNSSALMTNNGLWQTLTDNTIGNGPCCGNPTFVNNGTFSKSSTYGTTSMSGMAFINAGTLDIESGVINFVNSGTYAQTVATLEFGIAAPNLAGQLDIPGSVALDGSLSVHLLDGYVPQLGDYFAFVNYASETGGFSSLSFPPLAAGQSWDFEDSGGSASLQVVSASSLANTNLQITGTVTSSSGGAPIPGVTVYTSLTGSNLVTNGSFEVPSTQGVSYVFYPVGSTTIPGWAVSGSPGANIDLTSYIWDGPAEDGYQFLDPTGDTGGASVWQNVPTVPGTAYNLIFYHGTQTQHGYTNCLGVTVGTNTFAFGETSGGPGNFDWRKVIIPFTASSNQTLVMFSELTGFNADDNFVDNVQVVQPGLGVVVQSVTTAGGSYTLHVPNGTFEVGVSGLDAAGYNDVAQQLVTMSGVNQTVNFVASPLAVPQSYVINTAVNPDGAGNVTGSGNYSSGATATLVAMPITSVLPYSFSSWTENGVFQSASATYSFTVVRDRNLVANFTLPIYTISVSNNPPSAGTVTGAGSFTYGSTNILTANPSFGYGFVNWTENGTLVGTSEVLSNVVYTNHFFVANYAAANLQHVVTTVTSPSGLAAVGGAGTYTNGQTANFAAPMFVTNAPLLYTFQQFSLSNTVVSLNDAFSKTFSTLDPTNLQYVAVYAASSLLPLVTNVTANYANPVPATTNFILHLQFNRTMATQVLPKVLLTNSAASIQPVVLANGTWTTNLLANDTYVTPPITIAAGMDGTMQLYVSAAEDQSGNAMVLTNPASFIIEATPPPNPVLSILYSNSSSVTVAWTSYNAPEDLAGFRVFIEPTNYASVAGLPVLTGLGPAARSFQYGGLSLDTPYYVAVEAVDTAGNASAGVTPLQIEIPSSLPPPVAIVLASVGASTAQISWSNYVTSSLFGFAGFNVYAEESNFTTVSGLTPLAVLGPTANSYQATGLDRTKRYYFAVVGFNELDDFNPAVTTAVWSDPYAGNISVNTTIGGSAPSTVNIYQSMTVIDGATLTIQPGTSLLFAPGTGLIVQSGSLVANGTALNPIVLDSVNDTPGGTPAPGNWTGVTLASGAGASSLQFVEIFYGGGLTLNDCAPTVQALTANFNEPAGLTLTNGAMLTTTSALISGNQSGVVQSDTSVLNIEQSVVQNNSINATASGTQAMNAVSNWWGTPTQASIADLLTGNVTYSPFLNYEPVLTPAIGTASGSSQVGSSTINLVLACRTATSMRLSEDFTFSGVFFSPFTNATTFALSSGGGLKHIFAQFRSVTGETNAPVELDVNYITAGPVIQSFSLSDGETLNRPLNVTASATAALGMADMEFYLDGVGLATNTGGSFSYYFDIRPLNNAIHQVELLARDVDGNIATLQEDVIVAVTPPLAPVLTSPAANYVTNTNLLTITGTAEENIALQVTDNGQVLANTNTDANGHFTITNATLVEGINSIVAIASDSTGQTPSAVRQVTVETIPPAAVIMNTPVYAPGVGIDLTWQYATSGKEASTFVVFWGTNAFSTTNQALGHSLPVMPLAYVVQGLNNGTYYFGVVGFDAAGNPSPLSGLVSLNYSATPPAFNISYGSSFPVGPGALGMTLIASEALSATPSLTIQPQGASSPILLSLTNVALNTWQTAFSVTPSTPSGNAAISVAAQDLFGNVFNGAPAGLQVVIDTTPPVGAIASSPLPPVQTTNNTNVSLNLTLTEAPAPGATPSLSFTPPQGTKSALTLTGATTNWNTTLALTPAMGSGFVQFSLSVTDSFGNIGTTLSSGGQLEIYNTALPSPPNAPTGLSATSLPGGNVAISWTAVSNAQIYRLYREPGTNFTLPGTLDIDNISSTTVTDLPPADGLYAYGVSASRLGSESAVSNAVVGLSVRTPPPAPMNVQAQLAATGVQVTWNEPSGEIPDHYNIYRNGAIIQTVSTITPVIDFPPRGTDTYIVGADDAIGNEAQSASASIQLLVGPVNNLAVLSQPGQAPVLSWVAGDPATVGFNIYRNGVKQNSSALTAPSYTDNLPLSDAVNYGVSAVNASAQESPQRTVTVYPVGLGLLVNSQGTGSNGPVFINYFDQYQGGLTNNSSTAAWPLSQLVYTRTVSGLPMLAITQSLSTLLTAGSGLQPSSVVPEAYSFGAQNIQMDALQQGVNGGGSVDYRQTYNLTNNQAPAQEIGVSVTQLPLAGGLTPFQVQVYNRGFATMQVIVARSFATQPGDVSISVANSLGQVVANTAFQGAPPGTIYALDGTGYLTIPPGSSSTFTVTNVFVPAALSGSTNTVFTCSVSNIYYDLELPDQQISGPLAGTMVSSSLAETPYYGTAQTDKAAYPNEEPVIISGQAIQRSTGLPLPNAALNIGFAMRGYVWYQAITTDANGNYSYTYNPPAGLAGTMEIWAANPLIVDQLDQAEITISQMFPIPSSGDITMSKNGTLDFTIQLYNPGDTPLTDLSFQFSATTPEGTNMVPTSAITGTNSLPSGFILAPGAKETVEIHLAATASAPSSAQLLCTWAAAEGAQATFTGTATLLPAVPVLTVLDPPVGYVQESLNSGTQVSAQVTIENAGLQTLGGITLTPPTNVPWMQVNLPVNANGVIQLPDLPPGQSNTFSVVLIPPTNAPLGFTNDFITIQGTNLMTPFQIGVYALVTSSQTGGMQFFVDDVTGSPVANAGIRLQNNLIQNQPAAVYTDTNGLDTVTNLQEGNWNYQVTAPGCSSSQGTISIVANQTGYTHVRLSRSFVTISFNVVPVPFSDVYTIQVEQTFQTHVEAGILVVNPPFVQFTNCSSGFQANFTATVENDGLIQMTGCILTPAQVNGFSLSPLITYIPVILPMQTIDVPFTFTYDPPSGNGIQGGQTRQVSGGDIAGCIAGAFGPLGGLADPNVLMGLAACLAANEQCYTDLTSEQATAALAALGGLATAAAFFAEPLEVLAGTLGSALGCIVGQFLSALGGGFGGGGVGPGPPGNTANFEQIGGCFAPNTPVLMADGEVKPISQVCAGDIVQSGPLSGNTANVQQVYYATSSDVHRLKLVTLDGHPLPDLLATGEHRIWVDGRNWTTVHDLHVGDWLFDTRNHTVKITAIEAVAGEMGVYTLGLNGDNSFYADGILVRDLCGATPPNATAKPTGETAK